MFRHFLNPPNWFTAASLFCSTFALATLMVPGELAAADFRRACILIVFGGVFDLLDGRVARLTHRHTEFGVQLDSIADIVGFGVAPALIAWTWKLHELGTAGTVVAFVYLLCAAFRLARFNVDADILADEPDYWPYPGHTRGLTSTMAGGCLVTIVWVLNGYLEGVAVSAIAFAGLVACLGYLMVSSIPFRHFKDLRRNTFARRTFAGTLAICLTSAVVFDPSMLWMTGACIYLTIGVVDGLVAALRQGDLLRAVLLLDR